MKILEYRIQNTEGDILLDDIILLFLEIWKIPVR